MLTTYSKKIKSFLCEKSYELFLSDDKKLQALAFLHGVLLFSGEFGFEKIKLKCENSSILELCAFIFINFLGLDIVINERGRAGEASYTVIIDKKSDIEKIMAAYGYTRDDISTYRIKSKMNAECEKMFLRGAFVACGTIRSPEKSYHLELVSSHKILSEELCDLIIMNGIDVKLTMRRAYYLIYCKDSEKIEDFLMALGAQKFAYDIINTRIEKNIKNNINRINNFETANIYKTVDAASVSLSAIAYLREQGVFNTLPEVLKETAILREENPELTLAELGRLFDKKISKSGVNHRLNKIIMTACEYSDYTLFV